MNMPSKKSGFRNEATPEDDIEKALMVSKGKRGFFCRNRSRRIGVASW